MSPFFNETPGPVSSPGNGIEVRYLPEGEEILLRPTGWARFFIIGFLAFWLCGWAVGEIFALAVVLAPILGDGFREMFPELRRFLPSKPSMAPWPVFLFVSIWLVFWTFGGISAFREMLRLLFGRDRFLLRPDGFSLTHAIGPFGKERVFRQGEVETIRITRRNSALVAVSRSKETVLTQGGELQDREWLRDKLLSSLALPLPSRDSHLAVSVPPGNLDLPKGWEAIPIPGGVAVGKTRSDQKKGVGCLFTVTLIFVAIAAALVQKSGTPAALLSGGGIMLLLLGLFLAALTVFVAFVRGEWHARPGSLEWVRMVAGKPQKRIAFPSGSLIIEFSSDSDNDEWFTLVAKSGSKKKTVTKAMNGAREVVAVGRFLAARSGLPIEIPKEALEE